MNRNRKGIQQTGRQNCYFCGSEGPMEEHHILPTRYGGRDNDHNLVDLCPTCHERLERLYDKDYYQRLGVEKPEDGEIDMGGYREQSERQRMIKQVIETSQDDNGRHIRGTTIHEIHREVEAEGIERELIPYELDELRKVGEVYKTSYARFATT